MFCDKNKNDKFIHYYATTLLLPPPCCVIDHTKHQCLAVRSRKPPNSSRKKRTPTDDDVDDNNNGNINKQLDCVHTRTEPKSTSTVVASVFARLPSSSNFSQPPHHYPCTISCDVVVLHGYTHSRALTHRTRYNNHSLCLCRPSRGYKRTCIMYTRGARLLLQHAIDTQKRN